MNTSFTTDTETDLNTTRQSVFAVLQSYTTLQGHDGLSATIQQCIAQGKLVDEYNEVYITNEEGRGTAEQHRRLGKAFASHQPGQPAKIVADIEGAVERAAYISIERRLRLSTTPQAERRADAERELFQYRVACHTFLLNGSVGKSPTPGPALIDTVADCARTDTLYTQWTRHEAGQGGPFLTALRTRIEVEGPLCKALRLHELAQSGSKKELAISRKNIRVM